MGGVVGLALVSTASGEPKGPSDPKPTPVDVSAFRDKLVVLEDGQGGTFAVLPDRSDPRVWYGTGGTLYEQLGPKIGFNEDAWILSTWAPRVSNMRPASVQRQADGSFRRWCGESQIPLKPVTADRVKGVLAKQKFLSAANARAAYLLARDDTGTYYYVDRIRLALGGGGYRVFVGKKGAMKLLPLTDVATDTAGDVFATATGEVRFVHDASSGEKQTATWIHGNDKSQLSLIDTEVSSRLIFKDLGIYTFLGTLCDDI